MNIDRSSEIDFAYGAKISTLTLLSIITKFFSGDDGMSVRHTGLQKVALRLLTHFRLPKGYIFSVQKMFAGHTNET